MDRRQWLGAFGASAAGLASAGVTDAHADHEGHQHDEHVNLLGKCAKICNEAAHHCLGMLVKGGPHSQHHAKSHEAAMDCQAFCGLTAMLAARSSPMAKYAHQACADACRDCAAACEGQEHEIMKQCAAICRECEKVCRQAGDAHHQHPAGHAPK